jgi:hypothetical protein
MMPGHLKLWSVLYYLPYDTGQGSWNRIVISLSQVKQQDVCRVTLLKSMITQDKMLCTFMWKG